MLDALLFTALKTKMDTPMSADETTMVHFLPMAGTPYINVPRTTATIPGA